MPEPVRVLVVSHSHPRLSKGGAEIAAYQIYRKLTTLPEVEAWFFGCSTKPGIGRDGVSITQPFSDREYLYNVEQNFDWFSFSNNDPNLPQEFDNVVQEVKPHIVHFHHYVNIGVEVLLQIRRQHPHIRIVMTLHEYLAICHHYGQMVKRPELRMCNQESPIDCIGCFPTLSPSDFFLRKSHILGFLEYVDAFISPSQFLAERYVQWGLARTKVSVIENLTRSGPAEITSPSSDFETRRLTVGFFGQISRLKGVEVMIDCAEELVAEENVEITFEIHGDYSNQPEEFREVLLSKFATLANNVRLCGPYNQDEVDLRMRRVDVVLVPSIWWENSPVVIQEAFRNGKPVVCSDIGGMAEKVRDGVDGFHFSAGNPKSLCDLLKRLNTNRSLISDAIRSMRGPTSEEEIVQQHMTLYRQLIAAEGPVK